MDSFKCQSKAFLSDIKKDGQDLFSKTKSLPAKVKGLLKPKKNNNAEVETYHVGAMFQYRDPDDYDHERSPGASGKTFNKPQFQEMDEFQPAGTSSNKKTSSNGVNDGIENDGAHLQHEKDELPSTTTTLTLDQRCDVENESVSIQVNDNETQSSNITHVWLVNNNKLVIRRLGLEEFVNSLKLMKSNLSFKTILRNQYDYQI